MTQKWWRIGQYPKVDRLKSLAGVSIRNIRSCLSSSCNRSHHNTLVHIMSTYNPSYLADRELCNTNVIPLLIYLYQNSFTDFPCLSAADNSTICRTRHLLLVYHFKHSIIDALIDVRGVFCDCICRVITFHSFHSFVLTIPYDHFYYCQTATFFSNFLKLKVVTLSLLSRLLHFIRYYEHIAHHYTYPVESNDTIIPNDLYFLDLLVGLN